MEKLRSFFGFVFQIINDANTDLYEKIDLLVEKYFNLLMDDPQIPFFIVNELKNNSSHLQHFIKMIPNPKELVIVKQIQEKNPDINPAHVIVNIVSLSIFPFMMSQIIEASGKISKEKIREILEERRRLIPFWIKNMIEI